MAKRTFTKYPSNYVSASTVDTSFKQITNSEFNKIVESYRRAGHGSKYTDWSLIVAELKGTYGLDVAKELADAICYKDVDACDNVKASVDMLPHLRLVPVKDTKTGDIITIIITSKLEPGEIQNIIDTQFDGKFPDGTTAQLNEIFPGCQFKFYSTLESNEVKVSGMKSV